MQKEEDRPLRLVLQSRSHSGSGETVARCTGHDQLLSMLTQSPLNLQWEHWQALVETLNEQWEKWCLD